MHRQRSRGENNSQNLTSVPVSIVEQTLALYYITLQRSRASASANILSFWSELGCPKSAHTVVLLRLSCSSPLSPIFWNQICVGSFVSQGWSAKNRQGNKVSAELRVGWDSIEIQKINNSRKRRRNIFDVVWLCVFYWLFIANEVMSKAGIWKLDILKFVSVVHSFCRGHREASIGKAIHGE